MKKYPIKITIIMILVSLFSLLSFTYRVGYYTGYQDGYKECTNWFHKELKEIAKELDEIVKKYKK